MEYGSILNRLEEQKKDQQLSAKLYRYTGLLQAIEFFSQRLNFDQIIDAAFDFVNELLLLEKSAIFVSDEGGYVLKKLKGFDNVVSVLKSSGSYDKLAMYHGAILYEQEQLTRFFEPEVLAAYNVTVAIPLIIDSRLYGFILIANKTVGDFNSDDIIISEALMKLFNNALENYKRYEELQQVNRELDEKIFNLFAINQSSKALLSELSLDVLYNLSVDVFSELTQSAVTGFVLYDDKCERFTLRASKDVFRKLTDIQVSLTMNKLTRIDINRVIIDTENEADVRYFNMLFQEGLQQLQQLRSRYIVLLIRNGKVLGFVSLGSTVTGMDYKKGMFELIESMASATYIALSNAQLFKQVSEQKRIIQGKLDKLISLNNLMKNINSSTRRETLLECTLKTLDISFDVEKAAIALYDKENDLFALASTLNLEAGKWELKPNDSWKRVMDGDSVYETMEEGILKYVDKAFMQEAGGVPGLLLVPIYIDRVEIEMLGIIMVFQYRKVPLNDEENLLTLETIAGHIAPVMANLATIEEQARFLLPNYIELFKHDLKGEIRDALEFSCELHVLQVLDNRTFVFKGNAVIDKLKQNFDKVYPFTNNHIFIILNEAEDGIEKKIRRITGINDVSVRRMSLGKDFQSFQEFFQLFN